METGTPDPTKVTGAAALAHDLSYVEGIGPFYSGKLREAGVVMLIGTDSGIPMKFHCQSTWNELDVWVNVMDIPVRETIRAATYWPAKMMKVSDRWGTVTAGKYADIIAVRGDVLKHVNLLQRVDFVMKGGIVYKRDGLPVSH